MLTSFLDFTGCSALGNDEKRSQVLFSCPFLASVRVGFLSVGDASFARARVICLLALNTFLFPEPTICSVTGGIVGLWYQPLPDVVKFTTSGSACLIR